MTSAQDKIKTLLRKVFKCPNCGCELRAEYARRTVKASVKPEYEYLWACIPVMPVSAEERTAPDIAVPAQ